MDAQDKKILHKKAVETAIAILVGAIAVFIILQATQQIAIQNRVKYESKQILKEISDKLEKNQKEKDKLMNMYHKLNISTAHDLREVMDSGLYKEIKSQDPAQATERLADIVDKSGIPFMWIVDTKGKIIASTEEGENGIALSETGLVTEEDLKVLTDTETSDNYVREENAKGSFFFYSELLNSSKGKAYIVFGSDSSVLDKQLDSLKDVSRVIKDIVIGESGFVFAVDSDTKKFVYYSDNKGELSGQSAEKYGLKDEAFKDNYAGAQTINGTSYYCISKKCGDNTLVVAASDFKTMYSSGGNAWQWSIAGFIVIALLCIWYTALVCKEVVTDDDVEIKRRKLFKFKGEEYFYNLTVMKRIMPVILLGVFIIFSISYYSCTLLGIHDAVTMANTNMNDLKNEFADADVTKDIVKTYYENQYLAKARILALLFEENPEVLNNGRDKEYSTYDDNNVRKPLLDDENNHLMSVSESEILANYCSQNDISSIYIYDQQGRTIATNGDKWYFILSFNKKAQSYPFRGIIDQKVDSFIQEMGTDEAGNQTQYIGTPFTYYTTTDDDGDTRYVSSYDYDQYKKGNWDGNDVTKHSSLLQIGVKPELMEQLLSSTEYTKIFTKSSAKDVYVVLFDDTDEHEVLYSPVETSVGKTAAEIGFKENAFYGDYIGFQRVNGKEYLIDIQYKDGYYIGSAILKATLFDSRVLSAILTAAFGLVFILFMTMLLTLSNKREEEIYAKYTKKVDDISDRIMFFIPTPSGDRSVTEKAISRWDNKNIPWHERTAEQKLVAAFFAISAITVVNIMIIAVLVGHGRVNDPVLAYVITGNWDKGFNPFALTACGLILITAILSVEFLNIPIRLVTRIFGTKSETVGHLLTSVLRYCITIYSLFYCLYLLGINSTSLLTSAGILSLIVGFGSQSLIKDIVAGIFIIFEGEFRVGDIVTINDYRGRVLDVGLRTTKLMSADHNIKIINNSEVSAVINMTRVLSLCTIDVQVAFGIPIAEVEEILKKELPPIKDKIHGIADGPYYDGIQKFDADHVMIQVSVLCKEANITRVRSDLYREVLDLIYRNGLHKVED